MSANDKEIKQAKLSIIYVDALKGTRAASKGPSRFAMFPAAHLRTQAEPKMQPKPPEGPTP
jgi:hypothetical protein